MQSSLSKGHSVKKVNSVEHRVKNVIEKNVFKNVFVNVQNIAGIAALSLVKIEADRDHDRIASKVPLQRTPAEPAVQQPVRLEVSPKVPCDQDGGNFAA